MLFPLAKRFRRGLAPAALLSVLSLAAAPASAATVLAQTCTSAEHDLCQTDRSACERECSDLTLCVRRCCEAFHQCLTSYGCVSSVSACPK